MTTNLSNGIAPPDKTDIGSEIISFVKDKNNPGINYKITSYSNGAKEVTIKTDPENKLKKFMIDKGYILEE